MRSALLLASVLLAGCPVTASDGAECMQESDCDGEVCARDQRCYPAEDVRSVTVTWTVNGAPAAEVPCMEAPRLFVQFLRASAGDNLDFAPVPCELGRFFVDILPTEFTAVEVGPQGSGRSVTTGISATGTAVLDLRF